MFDQVRRLAISVARRASAHAKPTGTGTKLRRPSAVSIEPRRFQFEETPDLPRYWVSGDPFLTHFMNALSLMFPDGEQMFVDAVRAVRSRVQDEQTRKDLINFMGQEALHSRAHTAMNDHLKRYGYPVDRMVQRVREDIAKNRPYHSEKTLLALTCALEHITAIMGDLLLSEPSMQALAHPAMQPLWQWHALEETEHKAVAFDVYQEIYDDYWTRSAFLVIGTIGIMVGALRLQRALLKHDGLASDPRVWARGMQQLWGKGGWLIRLAPKWLDYFRPDFHPWQHDNSELVVRYRAQFEQPREENGPRSTVGAPSQLN